mmetsp:Transcript_46676/g.110999  ORF Transcript_46676/g.110999 Transcript_46676/m.110999 type:complete len:118 (-) Transcript_46676:352-705(-)|eukprot:CAMPEP_0178426616 /NCGR_PEP_ID=MMETSP0689_2-20121128/29325_1 /TAXON_ID=160604 /ORGANISM="Amphidinium massartii, Strain CS-259" /LENGTH=117 /DNA_ID=CAMNT_0020048305 /DNA_START=64 /DNA_END=417 /DNA_ORIENTATION=+
MTANSTHIVKQGATVSPVAVILKLLAKLKYLGLLGYALEWLMEYAHVNHKFGRWLGRCAPLRVPKAQLLAVTMIIVGHVAEHLHHGDEHHHHEHRIAELEARLAEGKEKSNKILHQH